jgi:hypothetical protein
VDLGSAGRLTGDRQAGGFEPRPLTQGIYNEYEEDAVKASEIEIGKEYLSSGSLDWQYQTFYARRVKVLSNHNAYWSRKRRPHQGPWNYEQSSAGFGASKGVLVEVLNDKTGAYQEQTIVSAGSIKGEWAVVYPVVCDNAKARRAAESAEYEARQQGYNDAWKASQRAKELGVLGVATNGVHCQVTPETLEMLLDLWKATRESAAA